MHEVADLLRWVNAFLFVVITIAYGWRVRHVWASQTRGMRKFMVALLVLFVVLAYGSLETYFQGADAGWRIPAATFVLLGLLDGLWDSRHAREPLGLEH